ncbi:GTPase-activating protein [Tulasnella sp. 408]|nr:GTPase-activating protein [Tulasnella sp. 408]
MAPHSQAVGAALAAATKIFATIDRVPPIDSADEGGLKPDTVVGRITFDNVDFNYPSRPDISILKGLNLEISAGSSIALVGASGAGKSTVVSLVERFYDPLSGAIKLDGVDIKELNIKWLRQQIGLVQQEPVLFSMSIRRNVSHGFVGSPFETASEEEKFRLIQEACVKANADPFIRRLPNGYDTVVGERGVLLSGGQKQRIAIARAIVSDPRILLLDEATSALDTQSEGVVQDALDKAAAGRTTITIAHRLSTIRDADQIYVIGDGTVLEHGTHNELLSNQDGPYAQLVSAQKLKGEEGLDESDAKYKVAGGVVTKQEIEQIVAEEAPELLEGGGIKRSFASDTRKAGLEKSEQKQEQSTHSLFYLLKRMALLDREDWALYSIGVIAATALTPVSFLAGYIRLHIVVRKDQANQPAQDYSAQIACESAAAVKTVQSLTREKDSCDEYSRSLGVPLTRSNRTAIVSTGLFAISHALPLFANALAFWYAL